MKKHFDSWRKFQKEPLIEASVQDYIRSQNLETYGDLVTFMKLVRSKKRSVEGLKVIADWATDIAGKGLVSHLVNTYIRKKPTDPQDFMKLFRIDPKYAAIIDNDVEEAFVQWFMKEVDDDTSNLAQMRLDSEAFDINGVLRRWLASTFDGRTMAALNESMSPEDIITDKYSYNSAKTSQHRWSPGRPIVDYHDTVEGRVYTITFPDGTNKADLWPTEESKPGENLDTFLSRTKDPAQLNLNLDPDIIKTIEESALSVLELPINNMYMDGKHITVQLNTDSREHAPEFTRLVQNRWAHSSECLKLEKMGYKVYISTKDKETPGFLLTKQLI
jgi:hypothetical protein